MKVLDSLWQAAAGLVQGGLVGAGLGLGVGLAADPAGNPNNWTGLDWLALTACGTAAGMAFGLLLGAAGALSPDPVDAGKGMAWAMPQEAPGSQLGPVNPSAWQ
jgi:hypothetical protein